LLPTLSLEPGWSQCNEGKLIESRLQLDEHIAAYPKSFDVGSLKFAQHFKDWVTDKLTSILSNAQDQADLLISVLETEQHMLTDNPTLTNNNDLKRAEELRTAYRSVKDGYKLRTLGSVCRKGIIRLSWTRPAHFDCACGIGKTGGSEGGQMVKRQEACVAPIQQPGPEQPVNSPTSPPNPDPINSPKSSPNPNPEGSPSPSRLTRRPGRPSRPTPTNTNPPLSPPQGDDPSLKPFNVRPSPSKYDHVVWIQYSSIPDTLFGTYGKWEVLVRHPNDKVDSCRLGKADLTVEAPPQVENVPLAGTVPWPTRLGPFSGLGLKNCVYVGPDNSVGEIQCDGVPWTSCLRLVNVICENCSFYEYKYCMLVQCRI